MTTNKKLSNNISQILQSKLYGYKIGMLDIVPLHNHIISMISAADMDIELACEIGFKDYIRLGKITKSIWYTGN